MRHRRIGKRALVAATLAVAMSTWPIQPALAILFESETVASTFSSETLDAPTSLSASAALVLHVNLTWTATVDVRATGYKVLRSTTDGGPYSQVATVAGTATMTYQDTVPLPGPYYYVLQTYIGSWVSPNSIQASVIAA